MYKMRLQELCQKRQWGLPRYTAMKCGPDHNARFGASVSVNSTAFDSVISFNSLKQAHDYVARLALLHFTSPSDQLIPPNEELNLEEFQEASVKIKNNSATLVQDIDSLHKIQLLKFTKQRNLDLPLYSIESNDSLFKAKVRISEQVFESSKSFDNSKEAENDAAKFALMSLLVEKDEPIGYKSLLQELTQAEGFCAPIYKTMNSGVPHRPVFSSSVDLEGEIFNGKPAKSKKLAELESARVAYLALIKRGASRSASKSTSGTGFASFRNLEQEYNDECSVITRPTQSSNATNSRAGERSTYLLNNKVRAYSEIPRHEFPEGIVVLPLGEDQWVAMSLEFPN